MLHVSRENPVTLWRQVKAEVRDKIIPQLSQGDQIPGEYELCERFGVSRTVVRQAISSIVNEGTLFRQQGRGTFIAPKKLEQNLLGNGNFTQTSFPTGENLDTRLISVEETHPDKRVKLHLHVCDNDVIYKVRRLRRAGDEPIAYQVDYLPSRLCPGLPSTNPDMVSIHRSLADRYGLSPTHITVAVECITADLDRAERLRVPEGAPLMVIDRLYYLSTGEPVRYSRTRYRHDRFKLVVPAIPLQEPGTFSSED